MVEYYVSRDVALFISVTVNETDGIDDPRSSLYTLQKHYVLEIQKRISKKTVLCYKDRWIPLHVFTGVHINITPGWETYVSSTVPQVGILLWWMSSLT